MDNGKLGCDADADIDHFSPQRVNVSQHVVSVSCGHNHTVALTGIRHCSPSWQCIYFLFSFLLSFAFVFVLVFLSQLHSSLAVLQKGSASLKPERRQGIWRVCTSARPE